VLGEAEGGGEGGAVGAEGGADGGGAAADPLGHVPGGVELGAGQEQEEGLGLQAGHGVAGAAGLVEQAGEGLEEAVAHGVAEALVDLGEAVQVGQDHRHRAHAQAGQAGEGAQPLLGRPAVGQAGEGVGEHGRAQADVGQPQLVVEGLGPQGQAQAGHDVQAADGQAGRLGLDPRDRRELAGEKQYRDGQGGRVALEAGVELVAGAVGQHRVEQDDLGALLVGQAYAVVGRPCLEDLVALGPQGGGRVRPRAGVSLDDQHACHQGCSRDGAIPG
jgi:hypothetical protein